MKAEIKLNFFIDEIKKEYNLENADICISGFSQGCMLSINIGLTSIQKFNCIVGFSGKIINKDNLSERIKSKTKVFLLHGDTDSIVPINNLLEAKDFLIRHKIEVNTKIIKNCEHSIPLDASREAINYITNNLYK